MEDMKEFFAKRAALVARLNENFEVTPEVVVHGVVSASGVAGGRAQGETLWSLSGELSAWRLASSETSAEVSTEALTLRRKLAEAELHAWQKRMPAYAVVALRARVIVDEELGPQARVEDLIGPVEDAALAAHVQALQVPVVHEDARFGACTLDRGVGWFTAHTQWGGREVDLHLSTASLEELPALLQHAHAFWNEQPRWEERMLACACDNLLALKNDTWLGDDEHEFSAEKFKARMGLQSVTFDEAGQFTCYYEDGDLFWGHVIMVSGSLESGPEEADIAG